MELEYAENLSKEIVNKLSPQCKKIEVVGSIRRKVKKDIHDIDIVAIPLFWYTPLKLPGEFKIIKEGDKIKTFIYKDSQVDLYLAEDNEYETLKLIRTGSEQHNITLCIIAKEKGWKLKAGGTGLVDENGKIIDNTEKGILEKLLGSYIEPELRI